MNLANKVKRKLMRDEQEQRRIDQEAQRLLLDEAPAFEQCFSELESQDGDTEETYAPFTLPIPSNIKRKHKKVKTGGEHFIPPDILAHKEVVECLTRNKITPTAGLAVVSSIITAIGGDTRKFKLSYGTSYRFRLAASREMAEAIKDQWIPAPISVLHWDEKLMETLDDKYLLDERMPVLLSGMGKTKLLGVTKLPTHSTDKQGTVVSSSVCALLKEWDIDTDCIKFMSFDTTSANTGHLTAACIQLQVDLNRPMLWLACRHHVGEIVLSHVWDALAVEVSKSPEVTIFHRLRDEYPSLTTSDLEDLTFPELKFTTTITKEEVLSILEIALKSKMARDDYKEVIVLTKLFITQDITSNFRFMKPGAIHKARWMAKLLCGYKLVLLEDKILKELPPGTIFIGGGKSTRRRSGTDRVQQKKLVKFVNFIVAVYVPWWVTCGSATDAAEHDIIFLKAVKEYEDIDPQVSHAALVAFCRHLWYLTPELLPLCLFSSHLEEEKKEAVCTAIVAQPKLDHFTCRVGTGYQKPSMPDLTEVEFESLELDYFVSPDSWKFFQITGIPTEFLNEPVSTWKQIPAFISAAEKLKDLQVKNDAAERGVRLGHEFLGMAVKENNYQNILQVAENSRKKTPNQRSKSASSQSGNWYLTW